MVLQLLLKPSQGGQLRDKENQVHEAEGDGEGGADLLPQHPHGQAAENHYTYIY